MPLAHRHHDAGTLAFCLDEMAADFMALAWAVRVSRRVWVINMMGGELWVFAGFVNSL